MKRKTFIAFLENLKTETNSALIESIKMGFQHIVEAYQEENDENQLGEIINNEVHVDNNGTISGVIVFDFRLYEMEPGFANANDYAIAFNVTGEMGSEDTSFSHEFGTEHESTSTVDSLDLTLDSDTVDMFRFFVDRGILTSDEATAIANKFTDEATEIVESLLD